MLFSTSFGPIEETIELAIETMEPMALTTLPLFRPMPMLFLKFVPEKPNPRFSKFSDMFMISSIYSLSVKSYYSVGSIIIKDPRFLFEVVSDSSDRSFSSSSTIHKTGLKFSI